MSFNVNDYIDKKVNNNRFFIQLKRLQEKGIKTCCIEKTVAEAYEKLNSNVSSFIIYGEPQSGKTELMIALTAKLIDEGNKLIIVLLNDNVGLLEQNLKRFSQSHINPDPKNFKEIITPLILISNHEWIIFCKKNSNDLGKLIEKIESKTGKIIIDDESDYASPNGKINKGEVTKINQLITQLLDKNSKYIGVTATPARLDLNNTFNNNNTNWVEFKPHDYYNGQETFFPIKSKNPNTFKLDYLPEEIDDPKYLRTAFFRFLVNVAILNLENSKRENYSMLIHTSGKKLDHDKDHENIAKTINIIKSNDNESKFKQYLKEIYNCAFESVKCADHAKCITKYIVDNKHNFKLLIINSERDKENLSMATAPSGLFTIAIGGNIVSRGVTFNNLLSMYFTRNVKTKMQQDTYIQRARMFGVRDKYLKYFNLTIPKQLYSDWKTCFVYHKLALDSVRSGNPPVWIEGSRTRAAASPSIDNNTVEMNSGEMSYGISPFSLFRDSLTTIESITNSHSKLDQLVKIFNSEETFPNHLVEFIKKDNSTELAVHSPTDISNRSEDTDKENISRRRGLIGKSELEARKYPNAVHHVKIFHNDDANARVFYKYIFPLKFLKNIK